MKNMAMEGQASGAPGWPAALVLFDRDLRRRGAAERTRRAYGTDVGELGVWAGHMGLDPDDLDYAWLRRYAAHLSERGAAPSTLARKLASLRAFYRVLVEHGVVAANPADLLPAPKQPQRLPRTLKAGDVAALLDRIPAGTPLELRDRALFELAYGSGLRAEELVNLDVGSVDFDAEHVRVEGKGGAGSTRCGRSRATSSAPGPRWPPIPPSRRCSSPSRAGGSPPPMCGAACAPGRATPRPRAPCIRTPSGTRSRPTSWRAAPTSASSRSCWATPRCRRRRSTLG
jgi:integrase